MFEGFSSETFDFINNLEANNEKPWFEAHKAEFQEYFQAPMKSLGQTVFNEVVSENDNRGLALKISRIYRDARYLRAGEGPYRTNLWFSIEKPSTGEWTDKPVFWFDLSPGNWSYGMGYGGAKAETMLKFRNAIDEDHKKFEELVAFLNKQDEFVLDGEEYSRKKQAPSLKLDLWYNKKSFSLIHNQKNGEELFSPDLANRVAKGMLSLMPIYDFLDAIK